MSIQLSDDQKNIVNFSGEGLKVIAGAGSGKTLVLKHRVLARPNSRMLYLAYNRPIKEEAAASFPRNCSCKTFHGLAFALVGRNLKHKLLNSLQLNHIARYTADREVAKVLLNMLEAFLISGLDVINSSLVPESFKDANKPNMVHAVVEATKVLWERMIDPASEMPITHDGYFKILALNPELVEGYDEILVDESQDANGAKIQLIKALSSRSNIVLVGDESQAINRWNGAINAFKYPGFDSFGALTLAMSYRFGTAIAMLSNMILIHKNDNNIIKVRGTDTATFIYKAIPDHLESEHIAVISRTTAGCIEHGVNATVRGEKVYWVGGMGAYGISDLVDVGHLKRGKKFLIKNSDLQKFKSYKDFCFQAETEEVQPYLKLIKLEDQFSGVKSIKEILEVSSVDDEADADITISTAHKSKGMDWDNVFINNDFPDVVKPRDKKDLESYCDELNLWYVTVTRAKKNLVYGDSLLAGLLQNLGVELNVRDRKARR